MKVKYFIPEDGDDSQHPNIFIISDNGGSPTLQQIKSSFPLPGKFHFRFLREVERMKVWMDITDDIAPVPVQNGAVFVKITRINSSEASYVAAPPAQSVTRTSGTANSGIKPEPIRSHPASASTQRGDSDKLLSFADEEPSIPIKQSVVPPSSSAAFDGDDLLGMSSAPLTGNLSSPPSKPVSSGDLFGLDTLQPMPTSAMGAAGGQTMNPMSGSFNSMPSMGGAVPRPMGMPMQPQMAPRPGYDPFGSINTMGAPFGDRGGQQQHQQPYGGRQYGQRPPQQRR